MLHSDRKLQQELEELADKMRDASLRGASLRGELDDQMADPVRAKEKIAKADAKYSILQGRAARPSGS